MRKSSALAAAPLSLNLNVKLTDNRIAGGKVILSRLLWPERAEPEVAVDESGLRCEPWESAFAPSGDGDFKH